MGLIDASQSKVFLTAEWRFLAMLNYRIPPETLAPYVPVGTELDSWNSETYISLVGFLFCNTCIKNIPVPFHRHFEEVNLRFYVRRKSDDGWRRGVVFIKEIVPKLAVAFIARTIYNENYVALPMKHQWETEQDEIRSVSYHWKFEGRDNFLKVVPRGSAQALSNGSVQEFITEHYWGYAKQRNNTTMEYRVEHPRWNVWETQSAEFSCDITKIYGKNFCEYLDRPPASAFLADGSAVKVYKGIRLK